MNIVIDQGNTLFKIGLLDGREIIKIFQIKKLKKKLILSILKSYQLDTGILCSTKVFPSFILFLLKKKIPNFYEFESSLSFPLFIKYKTPKTLGCDRLAASVGAWYQKPNNNLLIIDIGTAITIDFVSKDGIYKGGNISPGPTMRFKALHYFTELLPHISKKGDIPLLGYDTETAIRSGVMEGIVQELRSYIEEYKKKNALIFLTGSDISFFKNRLKKSILVDKYLVIKGLNEILIYQKLKVKPNLK